MSFTVVPLHNLDLGTGTRIPFGTKFVLQDVPQWLKDDTRFLGDLSRHDPGSPSPPRWGARNFTMRSLFVYESSASIDWVGSRSSSARHCKISAYILVGTGKNMGARASISAAVVIHQAIDLLTVLLDRGDSNSRNGE